MDASWHGFFFFSREVGRRRQPGVSVEAAVGTSRTFELTFEGGDSGLLEPQGCVTPDRKLTLSGLWFPSLSEELLNLSLPKTK